LSLIQFVIRKTETKIDDILLKHRVFNRLSTLVPWLILLIFSPFLPGAVFFERLAIALICLSVVLTLDAFLDSLHDIYQAIDSSSGKPIKGYLQVVKIILFLVGTILIISTLIGKSPLLLLSGIGAMTAVLILVFRDTILSIVASYTTLKKLDHWLR